MGLNTFFIYLMAAADIFDSVLGWFYWNNPNNTPVNLAFNHIFCNNPLPAVRPTMQLLLHVIVMRLLYQ